MVKNSVTTGIRAVSGMRVVVSSRRLLQLVLVSDVCTGYGNRSEIQPRGPRTDWQDLEQQAA